MIKYWWIPIIIIWYGFYYFATKKSNDTQTSFWFWMTFFVGMCPLWAWVGKYSKNLIFDGLLYDILIVLVYVATMFILGAGDKFKIHNWIGIFFILCGFVLIKLKWLPKKFPENGNSSLTFGFGFAIFVAWDWETIFLRRRSYKLEIKEVVKSKKE